MLPADDHQLDALVRSIDPDKFSPRVHGPGFVVLFDVREGVVVDRPGLLNRMLGAKDRFAHYFVKRLDKPLVVREWPFRWADGARNVELEFSASFEIMVSDEAQARRLVAALHRAEGPARGLHALIDRQQHEHVQRLSQQCLAEGRNLLEQIMAPAGGTSGSLDRHVSVAVARELGCHFVIGFKPKNLPTSQILISRHQTDFTVPEVSDRFVHTDAQLQLANFQAFAGSGLRNAAEAEVRIRQFIDEAVRDSLFGTRYYEIARDFERTLKPKIEEAITRRARTIGYEIRMFQTQPNIDVLCLAHAFRVDLGSDKYEFRPRSSSGYVKMDVSVEVSARDYAKVARLVTPGMNREQIRSLLEEQLVQICRDEIQRIDRKQFNLAFDSSLDGTKSVVEILRDAFTRLLDERYGLRVSVINISQAQTEEGERFQSIRGKSTPFELNITSQADGGQRDKLRISGMFEVVDIVPERWDTFESKDYGFRKASSHWSAETLSELTASLRQRIGHFTDADLERERRSAAVRNELGAMAQRIASVLEERISKLPDVANRSRDGKEMVSLASHAEQIARDSIESEFGVIIAFRQFQRRDTQSEQTQSELLERRHRALLARADSDLAKSQELADESHRAKLKYLGKLHERKEDQLDREATPEQREEAERLEALIRRTVSEDDWTALPASAVKSVLDEKPRSGKKRPSLGEELSGRPALPDAGKTVRLLKKGPDAPKN